MIMRQQEGLVRLPTLESTHDIVEIIVVLLQDILITGRNLEPSVEYVLVDQLERGGEQGLAGDLGERDVQPDINSKEVLSAYIRSIAYLKSGFKRDLDCAVCEIPASPGDLSVPWVKEGR
jgi:hypothetical protein